MEQILGLNGVDNGKNRLESGTISSNFPQFSPRSYPEGQDEESAGSDGIRSAYQRFGPLLVLHLDYITVRGKRARVQE